jgi:hypothetical protein
VAVIGGLTVPPPLPPRPFSAAAPSSAPPPHANSNITATNSGSTLATRELATTTSV